MKTDKGLFLGWEKKIPPRKQFQYALLIDSEETGYARWVYAERNFAIFEDMEYAAPIRIHYEKKRRRRGCPVPVLREVERVSMEDVDVEERVKGTPVEKKVKGIEDVMDEKMPSSPGDVNLPDLSDLPPVDQLLQELLDRIMGEVKDYNIWRDRKFCLEMAVEVLGSQETTPYPIRDGTNVVEMAETFHTFVKGDEKEKEEGVEKEGEQ